MVYICQLIGTPFTNWINPMESQQSRSWEVEKIHDHRLKGELLEQVWVGRFESAGTKTLQWRGE